MPFVPSPCLSPASLPACLCEQAADWRAELLGISNSCLYTAPRRGRASRCAAQRNTEAAAAAGGAPLRSYLAAHRARAPLPPVTCRETAGQTHHILLQRPAILCLTLKAGHAGHYYCLPSCWKRWLPALPSSPLLPACYTHSELILFSSVWEGGSGLDQHSLGQALERRLAVRLATVHRFTAFQVRHGHLPLQRQYRVLIGYAPAILRDLQFKKSLPAVSLRVYAALVIYLRSTVVPHCYARHIAFRARGLGALYARWAAGTLSYTHHHCLAGPTGSLANAAAAFTDVLLLDAAEPRVPLPLSRTCLRVLLVPWWLR